MGALTAGDEGDDRMGFWEQIDEARERWDVLEHRFYRRWSAGELTLDELGFYAGQYRHAVVALAGASDAAARRADPGSRPVLLAHAAEERAHVELWDGFGRAVGARAAPALAETDSCARAWAGREERGLLATLVALYAIEAGQPAISETKRAGLVEHYGMQEGAATAYFDVHAVRDHHHAAEGRELIAQRLGDGDVDFDGLLAEAEAVLRANWELLDGVDARG
ncbi:MAG: iron-containing redox enzyme family protein [Solirubrobacteraceae bacterium]